MDTGIKIYTLGKYYIFIENTSTFSMFTNELCIQKTHSI